MKGSIVINQELCKGCLPCAAFCPKRSILPSKMLNLKGCLVAQFDAENECTGCATCALICPEIGIGAAAIRAGCRFYHPGGRNAVLKLLKDIGQQPAVSLSLSGRV